MTSFANVAGGASSTAPAEEKASTPSLDDLQQAATFLGCEVAAIQAVASVEAGTIGAWLPSGDPTMLYERHVFHRLTDGRFDAQAPELSNSTPGGYGKYSAQPGRVAAAVLLDRPAALQSTSFGLYQVLALNWQDCGFPSLEDFVSCMYRSVQDHLRAFVGYIAANGEALSAIREKDWIRLARAYNGKNFRANGYDSALAKAYAAATGGQA